MVFDPDRVRHAHEVASRGSVNCGVSSTHDCWRSSGTTVVQAEMDPESWTGPLSLADPNSLTGRIETAEHHYGMSSLSITREQLRVDDLCSQTVV